jgi:tetratricopeptide (TPR) repeat protein
MSAVPYTGDEPRVFVSYPREDLSLVQEELDRLDDLGVRLDFATDEEPVDVSRLQEAAFYLLLVSDSTEDDPHLRKEISSALQEGKDGLCIHVFDVPLDGPIKLLLKSLPQVSRPPKDDPDYQRKAEAYLRRLVQALPDEVKSKPIELPGDDRPAAPPPSRSNPNLGEGVAALGNAKLGGIALVAVVVILGLLSLILSSDDKPPLETPTPTQTEEEDTPRKTRKRPRYRASTTPLPLSGAAGAANALADAIPVAETALEADKPAEALEALKVLDAPELSKNARGRTEAHLLRARALRKTGKDKEACAELGIVIAAQPKRPEHLSERAEAYMALGDSKAALADLSKILELTPKDDFAWSARGDYYLELKRYEEAIADFSQAIELQPRSKGAYLKRAFAKEQSGDAEGASEDREKALGR